MNIAIPLPLYGILTPYYKISNPGFFLFGHGVIDKPKTNNLIQDLHIEMNLFISMIELWEKMGFAFLSMEEAVAVVLHGERINKPWIHLTFDDGYKNNYTVLYPYLSSKKIPFTIFLSVRNIIEQRRFDNYKIYCALTHCKDLKKRNDVLKPHLKSLPVSQHPDADILAMVKLFKYFKTHEKEDFLNKVNSLLSVSEWHEYNRKYDSENVLSGEDIRNMSNDPLVHFGSHGYNHYILSTLSEEQINFEQTESKRIIFKLTGKETNSYCYPNGKKTDFPHNIGVLTEQNGYKTGFTTLHDKYRELTLPFEIPRFPLSYRALPGLFLKLL